LGIRLYLRIIGIADLSRIQNIDKRKIIDLVSSRTWLSSNNNNRLSHSSHAVTRPRGRCRAHVLEGIPATGRNPKGGEISKICPLFSPTAKDVHDIVNERGGVALSWRWYITNAIQLGPFVRGRIIAPNVVEPLEAVCPAEANTVSKYELGRLDARPLTGTTYHCA
jgi:hypothetical protein